MNPVDRREIETTISMAPDIPLMIVGGPKTESEMSQAELRAYFEKKLADLNAPGRVTQPSHPVVIGLPEDEPQTRTPVGT
jgi:hypothetical protein